MTDLLLLGILIMQVLIFHNHAPSSGRYMEYYDAIVHRLTRYLKRKTVAGCCKGYSKSKESYHKIKEKIKGVQNGYNI